MSGNLDDLGSNLFTGGMIDHYTPPPGFQFDDRVSPPIVENLYSGEYNVPGKSSELILS